MSLFDYLNFCLAANNIETKYLDKCHVEDYVSSDNSCESLL